MSNDNFEIIKHFGPSIIKTKIPTKMVEEINKYVDEMTENKEKLKKLDHGDNLVADGLIFWQRKYLSGYFKRLVIK